MPVDTILLIIVVIVLLVVASLLVMILKRPQYDLTLDSRFTEQIANLGQQVRHYADVSAVLNLLDGLEEDPDTIERLRDYPETVRAAAWLHYVNCLGSDLQNAQANLSTVHQTPDSQYGGAAYKAKKVTEAQAHVNNVRAKLDAAVKASGQPVGPRAV